MGEDAFALGAFAQDRDIRHAEMGLLCLYALFGKRINAPLFAVFKKQTNQDPLYIGMLELAQVALLDDAVHILAVVLERHRQVLFDADRLVVQGLSRHGEIIPLFPLLRYSSVDWLATSPLAF